MDKQHTNLESLTVAICTDAVGHYSPWVLTPVPCSSYNAISQLRGILSWLANARLVVLVTSAWLAIGTVADVVLQSCQV